MHTRTVGAAIEGREENWVLGVPPHDVIDEEVHTEKSYQINPKLNCIYHFPIDLEQNGRPFGSKSIGKW